MVTDGTVSERNEGSGEVIDIGSFKAVDDSADGGLLCECWGRVGVLI